MGSDAGVPGQGNAPLTRREELVAHLEEGCKPKKQWRVGTEHEKFGFLQADLSPLPYEHSHGIRALLLSLSQRFGWQVEEEEGQPIALTRGQAAITLEPGGQIELSGAPLRTIHETHAEIESHLAELAAICREHGVAFIGLGVQPKWPFEAIPWMPKGRYARMRAYLPTRGHHALDMMARTATVQANLDFSSERDMVRKFRLSLALQPLVTALFANSPFLEGRPNGWLSFRMEIWRHTDPDRCGRLPMVFEKGFGFERYVDWALSVPMLFLVRQGRYLDAGGRPFREFLEGRLPALPGEHPSRKDWMTHLTTLFPDVRLKHYLELRGADAGNSAHLCALPALWKGLLYDGDALEAAWDLVKGWSVEEREQAHRLAPRVGLATPVPGGDLRRLGRQVVEIAREGLARIGHRNAKGCNESIYLKPVEEVVESGRCSASRMLEAYGTRWGGTVDPLFREMEFDTFLADCQP